MTVLTHDQARQFLEMDRTLLSGAEWSALKQHLADCVDCRSYAAELEALQGAVEHALRKHWEGMRPDPQLESRVQSQVRNQIMPKKILNNTLGLAGLALFTLIVIALFSTRTSSTATNSPLATPAPLSSRDFYQIQRLSTSALPSGAGLSNSAVSPDGRYLVYSGQCAGTERLNICRLDLTSSVETALTNDPAYNYNKPVWSPDGLHIEYDRFAVKDSNGDNYSEIVDHGVMNADGSNPQIIFNGAKPDSRTPVTWSPSSDRMAFIDQSDLVVVSVNDRHVLRRFGPLDVYISGQLVWLDENRCLFAVVSNSPSGLSKWSMANANIATGALESVTGPDDVVSPVAVRNNEVVYVQLIRGDMLNTARVMRQDLSGTYSVTMSVFETYGVDDTLGSPDGRFVAIRSADGEDLYIASERVPDSWQHAPLFNLLADRDLPPVTALSWLPDSSGFIVQTWSREASPSNNQFNLYVVRLNSETIKLVEDNAPIAQVPPRLVRPTVTPTLTWTPEPHMKFNGLSILLEPQGGASLPVVSPDGRRVIYISVRDGNRDLYQSDFTTLAEKRLTTDPRAEGAAAWSPDGSRIAYQRYASTSTDAQLMEWVVMEADGSNPQVVASGTQPLANERPVWSPSGDRLAVTSGADILIINVNDRHELRRFSLAEKPLHSSLAWLDNERLVFIDQGAPQLGDVATGTVTPITGPSGAVAQALVWNSALVYIQQTDTATRVIRQNLDGSQATTLATLTNLTLANPVAGAVLSPDGHYLAIETDSNSYVAYVGTDRSVNSNSVAGTVSADVLFEVGGISWLSDSSGFVCVSPFNQSNKHAHLCLVQPGPGAEDKPFAPLILPTGTPTPTRVGDSIPTSTPTRVGELFPTPTPILSTASPTPVPPVSSNAWQAVSIKPVTISSFNGYRPAVAPDGQRAIYADERDGHAGIFAIDLKTREVTRLTTDAFRDLEAAWSPSGTRIAYQHLVPSVDGATSTIEWIVINADGSNKQVVASGAPWSAGSEAPAWSPDGTRLAFTNNTELVVVNVADGRELKRFGPVDVLIHSQPSWLDDQRLVFVGAQAVQIANLTTSTIEKMVNTSNVIQALSVPPDIVYLQQGNPSAHVIRLKSDGTQSEIGVLPGGMIGAAAASPGGRFVAVEAPQGLYLVGEDVPASLQQGPLLSAQTNGTPAHSRGIAWLPDSSGFVYVAESNGQPGLYLAQPNEKAFTFNSTPEPTPVLLTSPTVPPTPPPTPFNVQNPYQAERLTTSGDVNQPAVSPDGQHLLYTKARHTGWDIYSLDLTTKVETRLTTDPRNDMAPSWSPDGTRIAYQRFASTETGPELADRVVMKADGSNPQVVASGAKRWGNERPAWSPAGDRLAFTDDLQLIIVNIADGRELRRFDLVEHPLYSEPVWFDEDHLLFIDQGVLQMGNVATGAHERVSGPSAYVSHVMVAQARNSAIVYVQQTATTAQVIAQSLDGTHAFTLTTFPVNPIPQSGPVQNAALSPNGRFVAAQTDPGIVVSYITTEQPVNFTFPTNMPPTDLAGITWLPDSSGFICVSALDGQFDFYLVHPIPRFEQLEPYWLAGIPGAAPLAPGPTPRPTNTSSP